MAICSTLRLTVARYPLTRIFIIGDDVVEITWRKL